MSQAEQGKKLSEPGQEQERSQRSPAEWVTFGIASFVLAAIVGLVVYIWLGEEQDKPPEISVEQPEAMREVGGQFYVPFAVTNTGGGTAESVQITAELSVNGEVEESGEQQIDFLSGGETEEGAFVFSQDPRLGKLTLRVASYKSP